MRYLLEDIPVQAKLVLLRAHMRGVFNDAVADRIKAVYKAMHRGWTKLCRVVAYVPTIWRNEDWDFTFIYELLEFKLKRVDKCLRSGMAEYDPKAMRRILLLLDYVSNEKASEQAHAELEAKGLYSVWEITSPDRGVYESVYWHLNTEDVDKLRELDAPINLDFASSFRSARNSAEFSKRKTIYDKYQRRHERRRTKLFKLLADNIERFWD